MRLVTPPSGRYSPIGLAPAQGDQIGQFWPVGLLLEAHYDYFGNLKQPKEIVMFLGYFLLKPFFTFLPKQPVSNPWFVVGILRCQNWFDLDGSNFVVDKQAFLAQQLFGLLFPKSEHFFQSSDQPDCI